MSSKSRLLFSNLEDHISTAPMRIRSACVCLCVCLVSYWLNVFTLSHNVSLWARAQLSDCVCFPRTNDCGNATHYRRWKRGSKWAFFLHVRRRHPLKSHMATVKSGGRGLLPAPVWLTALWTVCRFFGGANLVNYSPALIGWLNGGCTGLLPAGRVHRVTWEFIQCWIIPNMSWLTIVATCSNFFKCNEGINIKKKVAHTASYIIECIIAWPSQLHSYKKKKTQKTPELYSQALRNQSFLLSAWVPGSFHPSLSLSLPV